MLADPKQTRPLALTAQRAKTIDKQFAQKDLQDDDPETNTQLLLDPTTDEVMYRVVTDEFGTKKVQLTPEEREKLIRERMLREAFQEQSLTFDDTLSHRIRVCYRVIREMCRHRGLTADGETLEKALKVRHHNKDPWNIPERYTDPKDGRKLWPEVVACMRNAERVQHPYRVQRWDFEHDRLASYEGLAPMPPKIPMAFITPEGTVQQGYDCGQDTALMAYIELFTKVSDRLMVHHGCPEEREVGRLGLLGVLDPYLMRAIFPTPLQIMAWETMLVDSTLDMLVEGSTRSTRRKLYAKHGLMEHEVNQVIKMAQARSMEQACGDEDINRSVLVMRLEDYIYRSREAIDRKAELNGIKQLAIILGLTAEQQDNILGDFVSLMTKVGNDQRRTLPPERKLVENTANGSTHHAGPDQQPLIQAQS